MYALDEALIATPVGTVRIRGDDAVIHAIEILPDRRPEREARGEAVQSAVQQLREYFAGERTTFDLPLAPPATRRGGDMRAAMKAVSFGDTRTYGELSVAIESSARAVGQACARNPFAIVVPCHRILGAGGSDHYSAGEGIATKQRLLAHEQRHRARG